MNLFPFSSVYIDEQDFYKHKGGNPMDDFSKLLKDSQSAVERYIKYRIHSKADAEDLLQEVYLAAYQNFSQLNNQASFKSWILSIARNKCIDYFRSRRFFPEIPLEELAEKDFADSRLGVSQISTVEETFRLLDAKDRQILFLYFFEDLPQKEISVLLQIPVGTVKSRLYKAKQNFKNRYPCFTEQQKGDDPMKRLPNTLPEYHIKADQRPPFSVKWEELMGWFLIPKLGESLSFGIYGLPDRKCIHVYEMKAVGKARIHGIEGVELTAREASGSPANDPFKRTFIAQLTDTHCRYLAVIRNSGDTRDYITFLDEDRFFPNWGFGKDNCGNEIHLSPKGTIQRTDDVITSDDGTSMLDIVGRYTVTVGKKHYDTVCVMDVESRSCNMVTEQFLDQNGRTILWRRFNRDDWALSHYRKRWSELLPENERLTVNGSTYVHWYDCITDYILYK